MIALHGMLGNLHARSVSPWPALDTAWPKAGSGPTKWIR